MQKFIENQQKKNWQELENFSPNEEYRCKKCNDRTFILIDNEATPCECRAIRAAENILKESGISEESRKKTFSNFNYSHDRQIMNALAVAKGYTNEFSNFRNTRHNSIIFMGQPGSGKSHLAFSIANELMDQKVAVVYMPYREVVLKLKQCVIDSENYNREMRKYKNAQVLLIDDLFKGNVTSGDKNAMFELINYRYFNNLPIIASTERDMDALLDIDEAIGSRILEMCKNRRVLIRGRELNYRLKE